MHVSDTTLTSNLPDSLESIMTSYDRDHQLSHTILRLGRHFIHTQTPLSLMLLKTLYNKKTKSQTSALHKLHADFPWLLLLRHIPLQRQLITCDINPETTLIDILHHIEDHHPDIRYLETLDASHSDHSLCTFTTRESNYTKLALHYQHVGHDTSRSNAYLMGLATWVHPDENNTIIQSFMSSHDLDIHSFKYLDYFHQLMSLLSMASTTQHFEITLFTYLHSQENTLKHLSPSDRKEPKQQLLALLNFLSAYYTFQAIPHHTSNPKNIIRHDAQLLCYQLHAQLLHKHSSPQLLLATYAAADKLLHTSHVKKHALIKANTKDAMLNIITPLSVLFADSDTMNDSFTWENNCLSALVPLYFGTPPKTINMLDAATHWIACNYHQTNLTVMLMSLYIGICSQHQPTIDAIRRPSLTTMLSHLDKPSHSWEPVILFARTALLDHNYMTDNTNAFKKILNKMISNLLSEVHKKTLHPDILSDFTSFIIIGVYKTYRLADYIKNNQNLSAIMHTRHPETEHIIILNISKLILLQPISAERLNTLYDLLQLHTLTLKETDRSLLEKLIHHMNESHDPWLQDKIIHHYKYGLGPIKPNLPAYRDAIFNYLTSNSQDDDRGPSNSTHTQHPINQITLSYLSDCAPFLASNMLYPVLTSLESQVDTTTKDNIYLLRKIFFQMALIESYDAHYAHPEHALRHLQLATKAKLPEAIWLTGFLFYTGSNNDIPINLHKALHILKSFDRTLQASTLDAWLHTSLEKIKDELPPFAYTALSKDLQLTKIHHAQKDLKQEMVQQLRYENLGRSSPTPSPPIYRDTPELTILQPQTQNPIVQVSTLSIFNASPPDEKDRKSKAQRVHESYQIKKRIAASNHTHKPHLNPSEPETDDRPQLESIHYKTNASFQSQLQDIAKAHHLHLHTDHGHGSRVKLTFTSMETQEIIAEFCAHAPHGSDHKPHHGLGKRLTQLNQNIHDTLLSNGK